MSGAGVTLENWLDERDKLIIQKAAAEALVLMIQDFRAEGESYVRLFLPVTHNDFDNVKNAALIVDATLADLLVRYQGVLADYEDVKS